MKTLYEVTGDIKDINTILVNLNCYRALEDKINSQYSALCNMEIEGESMVDSIKTLSKLLARSLDTNLMLSEKLTNAQARWLGRDAQTTN